MERAVSSSSQEDFETSEPALRSPLSFSRPWALGLNKGYGFGVRPLPVFVTPGKTLAFPKPQFLHM